MGARTTIHDVAKAAGVSVSTVSKAVNGRYGIADATVRRVLDAVKELGYESSLVASSMRARRTGVIGVLLADFEPFSVEILKGVGAAMHDTGFDLLAYAGSHHGASDGWERRSLSRLSGTLIDAAIMVTPTVVNAGTEIPVVAVDPHTGRADLPTVESDSFGGALAATRHLIELGHRRIGFLAGRPDLRSAGLRDAGYRRALADAGIPLDPSLIGIGRYELEATRESARVMLSGDSRPTAVFAANDLSAIAVIDVAHQLGLRVPADLSVVGFDDVPEATRRALPLTTIQQPMRRLGAVAADMVFTLLSGGEIDEMNVILPTRLVVRATTAAPPR
ncbi:LacI family DNA-binding transcriptional regulator [Microbacterium phyllosphaerae]|uniref:LacI family DNA-binding transcriptional regulator n=1 Tax=Microbacterium phyllosphaerae TaxID=124798 RepID=UPI002167DEB4|nr:LacI family DNA-binding transcriptional regulator [Microbacterium phyllosphaerae]MCS3444074.1 LacI family transcriptional regulator [Microbacterium phyllosphaerae]